MYHISFSLKGLIVVWSHYTFVIMHILSKIEKETSQSALRGKIASNKSVDFVYNDI